MLYTSFRCFAPWDVHSAWCCSKWHQPLTGGRRGRWRCISGVSLGPVAIASLALASVHHEVSKSHIRGVPRGAIISDSAGNMQLDRWATNWASLEPVSSAGTPLRNSLFPFLWFSHGFCCVPMGFPHGFTPAPHWTSEVQESPAADARRNALMAQLFNALDSDGDGRCSSKDLGVVPWAALGLDGVWMICGFVDYMHIYICITMHIYIYTLVYRNMDCIAICLWIVDTWPCYTRIRWSIFETMILRMTMIFVTIIFVDMDMDWRGGSKIFKNIFEDLCHQILVPGWLSILTHTHIKRPKSNNTRCSSVAEVGGISLSLLLVYGFTTLPASTPQFLGRPRSEICI